MRNLQSWLAMLFFSVIAQIQTFLFCGLACGYAFGVYAYLKLMRYEFIPSEMREIADQQGPATGVYLEQWEDVYHAGFAGDAGGMVQQMPIVGWYFLAGFLVGSVVFVIIVNVATIYHLRRLATGASKLIDDLGAESLVSFSEAGKLKLVPKVVHELSVEFGVPAPELYLLPEEEGINAFIAGRRKSEAVLVITHGLRHLNETQLRGIIAHELAHLTNGDMVHNMRLLALELGVNSVRHTAEWMLRTGWNLLFGGSSNHRAAMMTIQWGSLLILFGMMVWPMGLVSSCAGAAAMALNNRRRELRADRLAAKVLGSWEPLAEALKRIAGHHCSGRIAGAECRKLGHLMFSQANGSSGGLFGSHPRMQRRIKLADRSWDGVPTYENAEDAFADPSQCVDLERVENALAELDSAKVELFRSSDSTTVTVPTLLLFDDPCRGLLRQVCDAPVSDAVEILWQCIETIDTKQRFALTELTFATARESTSPSIGDSLTQLDAVLPRDCWSAWFWTQVFIDALVDEQKPARVTKKDCRGFESQLATLFSLAVALDTGDGTAGNMHALRFQRLWMSTGLEPVEFICFDELNYRDVAEAAGQLSCLPRTKLRILVNCITDFYQSQSSVSADQAGFIRYLTARWNVAAGKSPMEMVACSHHEPQLSFRH